MQEVTIKDLEQQIAELSIENVKLKEQLDKTATKHPYRATSGNTDKRIE